MTNHFNRLNEGEQERLAILAEEAAEVVQSAMKILRHGYESRNPLVVDGESNREALQRELGDLMHAMHRMIDRGDILARTITTRQLSKPGHIEKYLHHQ